MGRAKGKTVAVTSRTRANPKKRPAPMKRIVTVNSSGEIHQGTGFINWPTHLKSSGEGGMWVMAIVPDDYTHADYELQTRSERPFEKCHVDTLPTLSVPNVVLDPDPKSGDPYIRCQRCGNESPWDYENGAAYDECPVCHLPLPDTDAAHYQRFPIQERLWPNLRDRDTGQLNIDEGSRSRPFLASVCLGTSNGTWLNPELETGEAVSVYYHFTRADLSPEGESLIAGLEALYGREVELLTFIDT